MYGLPITTIKSGQIPSIISILLTCVYVIYYINLMEELSFEAIEKDRVDEVIFTSLDTKALGCKNGSFVKLIYGSIIVSFLVACVVGIVIDANNRCLCIIMLFSITTLAVIEIFVGRMSILGSFEYASWSFSSIFPTIPLAIYVVVLTMSLHVVTPLISCAYNAAQGFAFSALATNLRRYVFSFTK
ncbi:hypothetical protein EJD97_014831 [Solanum chilense]|uniref:Uncharacterized protein n=1 Tax=Solanum chilense TaxID=4083 RepID=A0A6N2BG59_SOLCI|nr:hypothetical protein EJD97_014831 [Solanum chilense]